jgi:hypothetical protein
MRWRLIPEDYGVQFTYIKGVTNTLADALSRLPIAERQNNVELNAHGLNSNLCQSNCHPSQFCNCQPCPCTTRTCVLPDKKVDKFENYFSMAINEDELLE